MLFQLNGECFREQTFSQIGNELLTFTLFSPCPKMNRALKKYSESSEFKEEFGRFKELFEYLEKHSGQKIQSYREVVRLYDTLWIEDRQNKT